MMKLFNSFVIGAVVALIAVAIIQPDFDSINRVDESVVVDVDSVASDSINELTFYYTADNQSAVSWDETGQDVTVWGLDSVVVVDATTTIYYYRPNN